ncbi:hypothetical protein [Aurantibacillus circumpalustris]|uniref:hypothetical protein n=1 Tax=Aurantibacillus circumpalustris TaxID=3036359 RepID=UPI00295AB212|nr:hypothetical protein [Aurantibacillus circumpalustris]
MLESFEINLPSGDVALFSIWKSAFKKETCYFAKMIELKKMGPKNTYGRIVRSGHKTIYYTNPIKLKSDLISFYSA